VPLHEAAAEGFGRGADDYAAGRPGYPEGVYDLLASAMGLGPGTVVVDVAAGTGKFTAGLVERGAAVVAVEPVEAMRAHLDLPGVEVRDGTAEALPVDDASADLVTAAQAFHWFDPQPALAEVARVLRPGGHLALVWNVREESVDWVAGLGRIMRDAGGGEPYDHHRSVDWEAVVNESGRFGPVRDDWFPNWFPTTVDLVLARVASTSWISALPDDEREATLQRVRTYLEGHPATRARPDFPFPHATVVTWCPRR
jgi:ubiquinone/menaquinone biosynthesis C-methylase UbiE